VGGTYSVGTLRIIGPCVCPSSRNLEIQAAKILNYVSFLKRHKSEDIFCISNTIRITGFPDLAHHLVFCINKTEITMFRKLPFSKTSSSFVLLEYKAMEEV
jgi:hypothetical protein